MRVFLTGATGVVGRRLLPQLLAEGHAVTAVVRSPAQQERLTAVGATPVRVDLFDAPAVRRAVDGHAVVVNLATHIPAGMRAVLPRAFRQNDRLRRDASRNLVDAALAAGAERFIQESFAPTYPDCGAGWIHEDVALEPAKYARTVLDAEAQAARFTASGGAGVVLRFAFFYGADSAHTLDMLRFARRGILPLPGAPDSYVSSLHTYDAATAVGAALGVPAGAYNVADDEPLTRAQFLATVAEALGVPTPRRLPLWARRLLGSLGETLGRSHRISNRKLKDAGGWQPRYASAREGWPAVVASVTPHPQP